MREQVKEVLDRSISFIEKSPWRDRYLVRVQSLLASLDEPCVLTVAGRVKAGKSTLINALLGQDLSLTGVTETTATINFFRFGQPSDPNLPVCCVWLDGRRTWETKAFLDSLQGTGEDAIRKAESFDHLEFYLPHPDLRDITLVDTPGTDAITGRDGSAHERVTDSFFGMDTMPNAEIGVRLQQLRQRHGESTRQLAEKADAVIYLFGQVANVNNQEFLTEFKQTTAGQTCALNAIGVVAKIDLLDDVMTHRDALAKSIAEKLTDELNAVVPVSAALWRAVDIMRSSCSRWETIQTELRSIPEERFDRMLASDKMFLRDYPDCPVPAETRKGFIDHMPWRVFVLVARALRKQPLVEAMKSLEDTSGFAELRTLLKQHFFQRGRLLRYFRILQEMNRMLGDIQRSSLHEYRQGIKRHQKDLIEFTDFITSHPQGKSEVANRMRRFLNDHVLPDESVAFEKSLSILKMQAEETLSELESVNRQFQGLQWLEDAPAGLFTMDEQQELRELFGMYARRSELPFSVATQRQIYWRKAQFQAQEPTRQRISELAQLFYGRAMHKA